MKIIAQAVASNIHKNKRVIFFVFQKYLIINYAVANINQTVNFSLLISILANVCHTMSDISSLTSCSKKKLKWSCKKLHQMDCYNVDG